MKRILSLILSIPLIFACGASPDDRASESFGTSEQPFLTYAPWTNIRVIGTNQCLAAYPAAAPRFGMHLTDCDGADPLQQFQRAGANIVGWMETCIDDPPSAVYGDAVVLSSCVGALSEAWTIDANGQIHNQATGWCVDGSPYVSFLNNCDSSFQFENFELVQLGYPVPQNAFVAMHSRCLDNNGPNFHQGLQLQTWDCNGSGAQRFQWQHGSNNQIQDLSSKLCLDIFSFDNSNGAIVEEWPCNGLPNQSWALTADGQVVSNWNGKCLDLASYSQRNGAPVQMWDCYGGLNQNWTHQ